MRQWLGRLVLFNQVSIQAKLHNTFTSLNHQASFTFQETDENIWNSSSVALLLEEVMEIKYSNFFSSNTSDKKRNDEHIHSSWREHTHNYAHNDCDDSFSCHQIFEWIKRFEHFVASESYTQSIQTNEDVAFDLQHLDLTELKCRYCIYCRTVKFDCIGWHKHTYYLFGRTLSILIWFSKYDLFYEISHIRITSSNLTVIYYKKINFFVKFFMTFFHQNIHYQERTVQNYVFWIQKNIKIHYVLTFWKKYIISRLKFLLNQIILIFQSCIVQMIIVKRDFRVFVSH